MKHVLLIEEFPEHDGIEVTPAMSIEEAAEWCYTGEYFPTRAIMVDLLTDTIGETIDVMPAVISVAFEMWLADDTDKTDVNNAPDFLLKHKPDDVCRDVSESIEAAQEDADHIRQELSNLHTL